jgi:hypothetical protein
MTVTPTRRASPRTRTGNPPDRNRARYPLRQRRSGGPPGIRTPKTVSLKDSRSAVELAARRYRQSLFPSHPSSVRLAGRDLNSRPSPYKSATLTCCATGQWATLELNQAATALSERSRHRLGRCPEGKTEVTLPTRSPAPPGFEPGAAPRRLHLPRRKVHGSNVCGDETRPPVSSGAPYLSVNLPCEESGRLERHAGARIR